MNVNCSSGKKGLNYTSDCMFWVGFFWCGVGWIVLVIKYTWVFLDLWKGPALMYISLCCCVCVL